MTKYPGNSALPDRSTQLDRTRAKPNRLCRGRMWQRSSLCDEAYLQSFGHEGGTPGMDGRFLFSQSLATSWWHFANLDPPSHAAWSNTLRSACPPAINTTIVNANHFSVSDKMFTKPYFRLAFTKNRHLLRNGNIHLRVSFCSEENQIEGNGLVLCFFMASGITFPARYKQSDTRSENCRQY
jgi:hypothetical protein